MGRERTHVHALLNNYRSGLTLGVSAYLLGYLTTLVFVFLDGELLSSSPFSLWDRIGWTFAAAHHVPLKMTSNGQTETVHLLTESTTMNSLNSTVPALGYKLLPAVLLAWTGYKLYLRTETGSLDRREIASAGAGVLVGYFPTTVVGWYLASGSNTVNSFAIEVTVVAGPDLLTSVVVMGIVYPVVCGAVGALIADYRGAERDPDEQSESTASTTQWRSL